MTQQQVTTAQVDALLSAFKQLRQSIHIQLPPRNNELWEVCLQEAKPELAARLEKRSHQCINRPQKPAAKTTEELVGIALLEKFLYSLSKDKYAAMALHNPDELKQIEDLITQAQQDSILNPKSKPVPPKVPKDMQQQVEKAISGIASNLYVQKDCEYAQAIEQRNQSIKQAVELLDGYTLLLRDYFLNISRFKDTLLTADFRWIKTYLSVDEICQIATDAQIEECIANLDTLRTSVALGNPELIPQNTQPNQPIKPDSQPHKQNHCVIKKAGKYYTLSYKGEHEILPNTYGMLYIVHLLQNPDKDISCLKLEQLRPKSEHNSKKLQPGEALPDDITPQSDLGLLAEYDPVQIEKAKEHLREQIYNSDKESDKQYHENELNQINEYQRKAINLFGQPRKTGDPYEAARKRVCSAITKVIKSIESKALKEHLSSRIDTGGDCKYSYDIRWYFE